MDSERSNDPVTNLKRTSYGNPIPGWALGALALVIVLVLLAFFTSFWKDSPAPGADVTAGAIIQNPNAYLGKTVTVSGDVERIFAPRAFNMDSGVNVGELLVLGAEPFPNVPDGGNRAYVVDDTAVVTGTVRLLVTAEVEREIGWDLDRQLEIEFEGKPVLIAKSISFKAGANRSDATGNTGGDPIRDIIIVVAAPDRLPLIGRRVELENVPVQSVVGDKGFWVGPDKERQLFVALDESETRGPDARVKVRPGQTVTVAGEIKKVPSMEEARKRWELGEANSATLETERVYLAADRVELGGGGADASRGGSAELVQFVQFAQADNDLKQGMEHEYTSTGIRRLADALGSVASRDAGDSDIERKLDALRGRAEQLQKDARSTEHADITRQALLAAADVMTTLQNKRFPNLGGQVAQVRQAAEDIKPDQNLLDQKTRVQTFFRRASGVLQEMDRGAG